MFLALTDKLPRRALAGAAAMVLLAGQAMAGDVTVFAAASLKDAMDDISQQFEKATGDTLHVSLAGSSKLARQIEQGAPADVFISANTKWMDTLEKDGLIDSATRTDLLGNSIVLVEPKADAKPVEIKKGMDLAGMLGDGHLAMALVDSVPAGMYGKASLESLGIWDAVAPKVAQAENVRAALALVASGEAPMGIVYATDAAADTKDVTVVGTFPTDSHPPIIYPVAKLKDSDNSDADTFLSFLQGDEARKAFEKQGFDVLAQD